MRQISILATMTLTAVLAVGIGYRWRQYQEPSSQPNSQQKQTLYHNFPNTSTPQTQPPPKRNSSFAGTESEVGSVAFIPKIYQLPGIEKARTAQNFKDWLAQFPPADQLIITNFDKTHFGVYSTTTSAEQITWMAKNGYPMPEDVVSSENIKDSELQALADEGNDKAGFLLYERQRRNIQKQIESYIADGGTKEELLRDNRALAIEQLRLSSAIQSLYIRSESPYKGYLMAQQAGLSSDPDTRSSGIIAGLLWAGQYGDTRASNEVLSKFTNGDSVLQKQQSAALAMLGAILNDQQRLSCFTSYPETQIPEKKWR